MRPPRIRHYQLLFQMLYNSTTDINLTNNSLVRPPSLLL